MAEEGTAMNDAGRRAHWEQVYTTKGDKDVSWFQESAEPSMSLLRAAGLRAGDRVIDIGGGASRLVDTLVGEGFPHVTVLDLSEAALSTARSRSGSHRKPSTSGMTAPPSIFSPRKPTAPPMWKECAAP